MQWIADRLRALNEPGMYSHWLYLVSALSIGLLFLMFSQRLAFAAAVRRLFARQIWFGPSARADYKMLLLNEMVFRVPNTAAFVFIVNGISAFLASFQPATSLTAPGWLTALLYTVYTLAILDLASYVTHRMQHEVPFFWRFHAVHHSAEVMNPLTVFRQHPIDMAMYTVLRGVTAGVGAGLFAWFLPASEVLRISGVNAGLFLFYLTAGLRHSHIPFAYPVWLRRVLYSPHMHQLHHSRAERHKFCNYGVVFSLWDRWFRTHIDEAVPPDVEFGTASDHVPTGNPHSLVQLYLAPFRLESQSINKGQRS